MSRIQQTMARTLLIVIALAAITLPGAANAAASGSDGSNWTNPTLPGSQPDVVSPFAPPGQDWLAGHRGVDLAASPGDPIHSAGDGVVLFEGWIAGRPVITVGHGSLRTTYEPVSASVVVGEAISVGEQIGILALGGHCSGECLHWGLKRGDEYLDPLSLLAAVPPILKPLAGDGGHTERISDNRTTAAAHIDNAGGQSRRSDAGIAIAGTLGIAATTVAFRRRGP